ncbi:aminoglycoside N(3)-acetyltransferase [Halobium salinum]|uniref:Aminoglycoside N(3)-acetyltransferase n=1 Tax=Halobium salinum TaxID=1364940 RepID=A0ABD5PE02_9EURY|nr:AAC(3) family N-acetyltransferase [Halobium salinum]
MEMVDEPVTTESMTADLRDLGVERGDRLLVHSSLSSLGWVSGGAPAVVDALLAAVGDAGTLVTPTHSTQCSDPSVWENPPLPDGWLDTVTETMSPYRPEITPTYGMGAIPECFRDYPETMRSRHPAFSFAARGPDASAVVEDHPLEGGLAEDSPLGRLYDREATVLMLGTDHATNTSLHLAEYRAAFEKEFRTKGAPMLVDGERQWVEWEDLRIDSDDFPDIGEAFEAEVGLVEGAVGAATAKLVDQRALVDFGVEWMSENRE